MLDCEAYQEFADVPFGQAAIGILVEKPPGFVGWQDRLTLAGSAINDGHCGIENAPTAFREVGALHELSLTGGRVILRPCSRARCQTLNTGRNFVFDCYPVSSVGIEA